VRLLKKAVSVIGLLCVTFEGVSASYPSVFSSKLRSTKGAGTPITAPQLYSAGYTDDLRTALLYITHRFPDAPLLGLGFSLGANVLTRYISQEGEKSRLLSGCALGCVSFTVFFHNMKQI
jgi:predicted alpha/beta-fold hydrolase